MMCLHVFVTGAISQIEGDWLISSDTVLFVTNINGKKQLYPFIIRTKIYIFSIKKLYLFGKKYLWQEYFLNSLDTIAGMAKSKFYTLMQTETVE